MTVNTIPLPTRPIVAGDHRFRITEISNTRSYSQRWTCERCGVAVYPTSPFTDCAAGPVQP